ncbi:hypothetical protein [Rhizobium sp. Root1220]|uniref:hypothetical protein n=1 Tax=Rhizobium sp. Root1220 TaxID=1736432 RepID=UPI0007003F36|nr:hypothetical protein [Rhizobium sp. Root1220]KQV81948.1 hypothetical protein ASC90_24580 [Rhizobium sp. Root1220]
MRFYARGAAVVVLGVTAICGSGRAADVTQLLAPGAEQVETQSGWTFTLAPYFWGAGMSGDIAQFGLPEVHVDASFSDIFDHLDFAAMAIGEARYGRYSVFGDVIYTKLSNDASTRRGIVADSIEVTSKTFAGLLGAGYTVVEGPSGNLDVVGAARLWSADTTISFNGGLLGGVERDDDATWVDALAGVKGSFFFTPSIYATGWAMVGAGGADLDWDVMAGVGYKFNETVSAVAGYRALGVDYRNDGFVFDVVQQGPILGVAIRF